MVSQKIYLIGLKVNLLEYDFYDYTFFHHRIASGLAFWSHSIFTIYKCHFLNFCQWHISIICGRFKNFPNYQFYIRFFRFSR